MTTTQRRRGLAADERDVLAFHAAFAIAAVVVLAAPVGLASGWRMGALTAGWHIAFLVLARRRGHGWWVRAWLLLAPLSVLMVLPDWFLAASLGTLRFPPAGFPMIGEVAGYMAGLWTIPTFLCVAAGRAAGARGGARGARCAAAAVTALVVFGVAEATMWAIPVWEAVGVTTVLHIAPYVLPAEAALGVACLVAFEAVRTTGQRLIAAVCIATGYAGALAIGHLLIEGVLLG